MRIVIVILFCVCVIGCKAAAEQKQKEPRAVSEKANQEEKKAGDLLELTINNVKYRFHWCPPGTFTMGSPNDEKSRVSNEVQHEVTLTQGFWMAETETTQEQWKSVMGNNPSGFKGAKLPVEQVSWDDCQKYIEKINSLAAESVPSDYKFALPTEAQWEYACRAGTATPFHFGSILNGSEMNCNYNMNGMYETETKGKFLKTSAVGSYPANAWGLCDMHGNVWKWCSDLYGDYSGNVTDPIGASSGLFRVCRGGSWQNGARFCQSATRGSNMPHYRFRYIGCRLSLVLK